MKNNIMTVMKKELSRFFGDKRMVFSTILLPGIMIYVMYSFMGSAMGRMFTSEKDYVPQIEAVNLPDSAAALVTASGMKMTEVTDAEVEAGKEEISAKKLDALLVFPENFDQLVAAYDPASQTAAPDIQIYYNSAAPESEGAYNTLVKLFDQYEASIANKFDINQPLADDAEGGYDQATEQDMASKLFASLLPMLLIMFLFSACMSVAPESIAGEKERGTMATLLVTPLKRSELAIGKIGALSLVAVLGGLSSTVGTLLALPKLYGGMSGLDTNVYSVNDYLWLVLVILATVLFLIAIISIISAWAKSVKEATTLVSPLMILAMAVAVLSMFGGGGAATNPVLYLIPLYNSVQSMLGIFSFSAEPVNLIIAVVSNLVYTGIGVFVLTKMFNSERIIFTK